MRYITCPLEWLKLKNNNKTTDNTMFWQGYGEPRLLYLDGGMQNGTVW